MPWPKQPQSPAWTTAQPLNLSFSPTSSIVSLHHKALKAKLDPFIPCLEPSSGFPLKLEWNQTPPHHSGPPVSDPDCLSSLISTNLLTSTFYRMVKLVLFWPLHLQIHPLGTASWRSLLRAASFPSFTSQLKCQVLKWLTQTSLPS